MVGVRGRRAGRGPGWAGLWTGEVILRRAFPRGTHDLRRENTADVSRESDEADQSGDHTGIKIIMKEF